MIESLPSLLLLLLSVQIGHAVKNPSVAHESQELAFNSHQEIILDLLPEQDTQDLASRVKNITFKNPKASEFYVDGKSIPDVDFNVGPSWAGLLPISAKANETGKLFFWFFPPGPEGSLDDLIFWTNGGPGCSSMEGILQENGPMSWAPGTAHPIVNEHSWTNLSSVLWVEQPIGTGYTEGTPSIHNEDELAAQLVGFFQQFLEIFSELKGKKFYLSGESYAGTYVPYIANYIYENPGKIDLSLQGIWIGDPSLSSNLVQSQIPAVDFVHKYEGVFSFNQTFLAYLDAQAESCGYKGYIDAYVKFPPAGPLPLPSGAAKLECLELWETIMAAALAINPGFNIYRIFDMYPILWDVLGWPTNGFDPQTLPVYFDRPDVKKILHVPQNTSWTLCQDLAYGGFVNQTDESPPPALSPVLQNVIEKSQRTVIVHGLADFVLIAEGTRIAIQNTTWNGMQGFQTPIEKDSFIIDGMGAMGTSHNERGLTYYEVILCGHMVPQFSPFVGFRTMQYLMGFKSDVSD